ncbi:hypothetical protein F4779DRAFT_586716 [Xylariaceae sp. FL0662B]|nr:hypothetical protein F4779DRAFT_586716 [Xylariaceae sp. FL0662B]
MPAHPSSTAQVLSHPISPTPPLESALGSSLLRPATSSPSPSPSTMSSTPSTPTTSDTPVPPWVRSSPQRRSSSDPSNARRLSTPYSRSRAARRNDHHHGAPLGRRLAAASMGLLNKALRLFLGLTPLQRVAAVAGLVAFNALLVVFLVYSQRIFAALGPVAAGWRTLPGGWALIFLMTCATAFPPMIGYSSCVTVAGFVYDFPGGWPVAAGATVAGSTASFVASRTVLSRYVDGLVGGDRRFVALGQVLRHDGLPVLAAIRFCPLPFSLSNAFLATIPSVSPVSFALATALATPKLLVHVFVGSRLARLAESGDDMSAGDRAVNYLGMILGSLVGMAVGLLVYRRTMARADELARQEDPDASGLAIHGRDEDDDDDNYADVEDGVLGLGLGPGRTRSGETDAAALMGDDDISLWETEVVEDAYRDDEETGTADADADAGADRQTNGVSANGHAPNDGLIR